MFPMPKETDEIALADGLKLIPGVKVKIAEPLARYTSMKIGGPADYFIEVETDEGLSCVLPLLHRYGTAVSLLGNGSNALISDRGVRGAVIHLVGEFAKSSGARKGKRFASAVGLPME